MAVLLPELGSVRLHETEDELVVRVEVPPEVELARLRARIHDGVLEIRVPRVIDSRRRLAGFHPDASGV